MCESPERLGGRQQEACVAAAGWVREEVWWVERLPGTRHARLGQEEDHCRDPAQQQC